MVFFITLCLVLHVYGNSITSICITGWCRLVPLPEVVAVYQANIEWRGKIH